MTTHNSNTYRIFSVAIASLFSATAVSDMHNCDAPPTQVTRLADGVTKLFTTVVVEKKSAAAYAAWIQIGAIIYY